MAKKRPRTTQARGRSRRKSHQQWVESRKTHHIQQAFKPSHDERNLADGNLLDYQPAAVASIQRSLPAGGGTFMWVGCAGGAEALATFTPRARGKATTLHLIERESRCKTYIDARLQRLGYAQLDPDGQRWKLRNLTVVVRLQDALELDDDDIRSCRAVYSAATQDGRDVARKLLGALQRPLQRPVRLVMVCRLWRACMGTCHRVVRDATLAQYGHLPMPAKHFRHQLYIAQMPITFPWHGGRPPSHVRVLVDGMSATTPEYADVWGTARVVRHEAYRIRVKHADSSEWVFPWFVTPL